MQQLNYVFLCSTLFLSSSIPMLGWRVILLQTRLTFLPSDNIQLRNFATHRTVNLEQKIRTWSYEWVIQTNYYWSNNRRNSSTKISQSQRGSKIFEDLLKNKNASCDKSSESKSKNNCTTHLSGQRFGQLTEDDCWKNIHKSESN